METARIIQRWVAECASWCAYDLFSRVRQERQRELRDDGNDSVALQAHPESLDPSKQYQFSFDKMFGGSATQRDVYEGCGAQNLIQAVLAGFNATIFAYGQTGSGKTYSMEGFEYSTTQNIPSNASSTEKRAAMPRAQISRTQSERLGIMPRALRDLFAAISRAPKSQGQFVLRCSYVQIYNEQVLDLLDANQFAKRSSGNTVLSPRSSGLRLRWHSQRGFYAEDLCVVEVDCVEDAEKVLHAGMRNKIMAAHNINAASSRSHCIFRIDVERTFLPMTQDDADIAAIGEQTVTSSLCLVDLAGSERIAHTGATGTTLKESIGINKSLHALRQVITKLAASSSEGRTCLIETLSSRLFCSML